MECHGQAWCGGDIPGEAAIDISRGLAEGAEFQLMIYGIEGRNFTANLLDVPVGESAHAGMAAAKQILIEIEHCDIKNIGELSFESLGIGGDVAMRRHGIDLNRVAMASGMVERCR